MAKVIPIVVVKHFINGLGTEIDWLCFCLPRVVPSFQEVDPHFVYVSQ